MEKKKILNNKMEMFRIVFLIVLILIVVVNVYQNFSLKITRYYYENNKLSEGTKGAKILQISDYHNKEFLTKNYFMNKVKETSPDLIFITGDIINSRNPDYDNLRKMLKELVVLAPVYYTTGNHEERLGEFPKFIEEMEEIGVIFLDDMSMTIKIGDTEVNLIGLNDPMYHGRKYLLEKLGRLVKKDKFNILLCHRPELFPEYEKAGIDLVFTGHAHGGQIRIPFIGAVVAPNQGFFPKYSGGVYKEGDSTMIESYGIGSSLIPIRIFAQPELVVVEIS